MLQEARIDGRLVMPDQCPEGIVDLSRARCDTLEDSSVGWPPPLVPGERLCAERTCVDVGEGYADIRQQAEVQHFVLDGFEYAHLEFPTGANTKGSDV